MSPITTENLIKAEMARTRLGRREVMQMVARAATVRELSRRYADRFYLKGGALLCHVYRGPRASFIDTDLADPTAEATVGDIIETLTIEDRDGFTLVPSDGVWRGSGEIPRRSWPRTRSSQPTA